MSGRCVLYIRPKVTHTQVWRQTCTLVTADMSFPMLVDTKCWDTIEHCSSVPTVQGVCVTAPFPADLIVSTCWDLSWAVFPNDKDCITRQCCKSGNASMPMQSTGQATPAQPFPLPVPTFGVLSLERIPSPHMLCRSVVLIWNFRGRTCEPDSAFQLFGQAVLAERH